MTPDPPKTTRVPRPASRSTSAEEIKTAVREALQEEREAAGPPPLKTLDDVRGLTEAEINARWPEASEVLKNSATPPADSGEAA